MKNFNNDLILKLDNSNNKKNRDSMITNLSNLLNNLENEKKEKLIVKGDPIIQIGSTFHRYGDTKCYNRSIL